VVYNQINAVPSSRKSKGLHGIESVNTLAPGLIQAVHKKQLDRTWLCVGISLLLHGLQTWSKCQKTRQVL